MKYFTAIVAALAVQAVAAPVPEPVAEPVVVVEARAVVEARQAVGATSNEFTQYGCRDVLFFFARGSTEVGNMGAVVGPQVGSLLKAAFGSSKVGVQGIDYAALLSTNFVPGGADPVGIAVMKGFLNQATSQCPNSAIVVGGYSQGAALVHRAVENLSQSVKDSIDGAVTFGDTQNLQDGGRIPNFPQTKTKIICAPGDLVCDGTLIITPAHLSYGAYAAAGANFLISRIRA